MTMPFRQRYSGFSAPCCIEEYKTVKDKKGNIKKVVDNEKLPPPEKFKLQNMLDAKIPLDEVSSYITSNPNQPIEPNEE